jgi:hypothetical protein
MAIGTTVTISGLELTSVGISGSVDTLITASGTANTVPPVKEAYNPKYELSVEGIDDGYTPTSTVTAKGLTFQVISVERKRTLGDVAKISIRGTSYPSVT